MVDQSIQEDFNININLGKILEVQSVHFAGLLDAQNMLSADTKVSSGKLKVIHSVMT
jgi:hypothetical protein